MLYGASPSVPAAGWLKAPRLKYPVSPLRSPYRSAPGTTLGRCVGALSVKPFSPGSPPAMTLIGAPLRTCSTVDVVQFDTSAPRMPSNDGVRNTDVRLNRWRRSDTHGPSS